MPSLLDKPEVGVNTLAPGPYQAEAFARVRDEFRAGRHSTLVIHATGLGKTCLAALIGRAAVAKGRRVLFLAHRSELLQQAADTFERAGVLPGVEKAESR